MRRWALCLLFTLRSGLVHASDEGIVTVVQPLETSGAVVIETMVPYIGYAIDRQDPTNEILLTVQPNLIWCDGKAQDRNNAARAGIRFKPGESPGGTKRAIEGDTLHVVVDLSAFTVGPQGPERYEEELVTTTLWCGLRNAKLRWPEVRFVRYTVEGSKPFEIFTGTYGLQNVPPPERPKQKARSGPDALRR